MKDYVFVIDGLPGKFDMTALKKAIEERFQIQITIYDDEILY